MNYPAKGDYIDIHTHGAASVPGIFAVSNLMVHEVNAPENVPGVAYCAGIHPWYLTEMNQDDLFSQLITVSGEVDLFAIGEAGFDKLRGPSPELQKKIFERQVFLAGEKKKPVVIHCVKGWDELFAGHKKMKPSLPWMVHGFRGRKELAAQLISRGMYLSFWFDFIIRPESAGLLRSLPPDRIFFETDGSDVDIRLIYKKAANDLDLSVEELKTQILSNFMRISGSSEH